MKTETLSARLKRFRLEAGLSQRELAEPEYTHAYVSTIEAGKREPSRTAVEHFARRLGRDVDEILTGRSPDLVPKLELELHEARRAASAGDLATATAAFERLRSEAKEVDLPRHQARAEIGLGLCAEQRGEIDRAASFYETALETLRSEPANVRVDAVAAQARCLQLRGENRTAIYVLEQELERLEQEGLLDPDALVRIHTSLVAAYFEQGAHAKASASAAQALELAPRTTNAEHQAAMHLNVARIFLQQGRRDDAHSSLRRAEDLFRELDLQEEIAHCHHSRGYILSRQGELDAAREALMEAMEGFERVKAPILIARTKAELARVDRLLGNVDEAREGLKAALSLLGEEDLYDLGEVYRELALCQWDADPSEAEQHLRAATDYFEKAEQQAEYASTCRLIGDLLHSRGDAEQAIGAYRAGILAVESTF